MRLLIIGGGFCGALVAKLLDSNPDFEITLFDKKDYFEYTPSIHKVIFNAGFHHKITVPFKKFLKRTQIVTEPVISITPGFVETASERYSYDCLVVSIGIDYPIFLENKENVCTLKNGLEAAHMGAKILSNSSICIIGGGLIGTEIAGELVTKTKGKKITIVHPHDRLLERNPIKASNYAKKFLEKHGAEIIFGEEVVKHETGKFITDKGRIIEAGAGLWCGGIRYNASFMKEFPPSIFTEKGALKVNEHLQLESYSNVFVGGDINNVPEEKTAQNAEHHAHVIAKNILLAKQDKPLLSHKPKTYPLVISLGDWKGIMSFPKFSINGLFPGILKWLIEWWVLWGYR